MAKLIHVAALSIETKRDRHTVERALDAANLGPVEFGVIAGKPVRFYNRKQAIAAVAAYDGGASYDAARNRARAARAELLRIRTSVAAGELIPVERADTYLLQRLAQSRGARSNLFKRVAHDVAAINAAGHPEPERRRRVAATLKPHIEQIRALDRAPVTLELDR